MEFSRITAVLFRERIRDARPRVRRGTMALGLVWLMLVQCSPDQKDNLLPIDASAASTPVAAAQTPLGRGDAFIGVAKVARASVVNISSSQTATAKEGPERFLNPFFDDPMFRRFFGDPPERRPQMPRERREQGLGSGVIVSSDGYIITNNHVVEQADDIKVLLPDKRTFKARVVGTDPKTDVAVIKIEAEGLPTLAWGDSTQLEVGEIVLAVGNPFGLNQTVTMGIISAVGRANMGIVDYEDFIQTDAAINPGNSGGALVNLRGELVGINTAIFSRTGGSMGIGFAIPSSMAKTVMNSLIKHGKVVRGWLGVSIQEVTQDLAKEFQAPDTSGALVAEVLENSPAAKAKLQRGDIVTRYNGTQVKDPTHLRSLVADTLPNTTVTLTVWRDRQSRELTMTVGELPQDVAKASTGSREGRGEHALAGVTVETVPDQSGRSGRKDGVAVADVAPDSPADRAGLRVGDVIREINRKPVKTVQDFERLVDDLTPKSTVLLLISRGNATVFLTVKPE